MVHLQGVDILKLLIRMALQYSVKVDIGQSVEHVRFARFGVEA
jgi:hypothetical protein